MEISNWCRFSARSFSMISSSFAILICLSIFASAAEELSLNVAHPSMLQLSSGLKVENSPGSKKGALVVCERVHICGLSRLHHMRKYFHSVKVKVKVAERNQRIRVANTEVCFHRNLSLGIGMCPQGQWEKLIQGSWVRSMSPYDNRLLDVRMAAPSLESLEVSIEEEFLLYRIIFLVSGILMLTLAPTLSESIVFYYSSAMAVGIILVILMILFQGMKLLPTGRKNSLAMVIYSSLVGVGSFMLRYLPKLFHSVLVEIGISDDTYNPVVVMLLVCISLAGAWLGFWVVRKLVLTEDGSIDLSVAVFVAWSIRIFAAVLIMQSSLDPLLATEALVSGVLISSIVRGVIKSGSLRRLHKRLSRKSKSSHIRSQMQGTPLEDSYDEYLCRSQRSEEAELLKHRTQRFTRASNKSPIIGRTKSPLHRSSEPGTYYSTFHNTPERKKFSKEEWEKFTRESTKSALEELVSSPDFSKWAIMNAERLTLTPVKDDHHTITTFEKLQRWFHWF